MRAQNILAVAAILWPMTALSAEFYDGNDLYNMCIAQVGTLQQMECAGYIAGVSDIMAATNIICVPPGVTVQEAVDVALKYLRDNPATRHYSAASDVWVSLKESFPCQNSK